MNDTVLDKMSQIMSYVRDGTHKKRRRKVLSCLVLGVVLSLPLSCSLSLSLSWGLSSCLWGFRPPCPVLVVCLVLPWGLSCLILACGCLSCGCLDLLLSCLILSCGPLVLLLSCLVVVLSCGCLVLSCLLFSKTGIIS
jgi:hypothetical protein